MRQRTRRSTFEAKRAWLRGSEIRVPDRFQSRRIGKGLGIALTLLLIGALTVLVSWLGPAEARLSGHPTVVDGDTLRFGTTRIRLLGIDAPELDQSCTDAKGAQWRCGVQSRQFLLILTSRGLTSCSPQGHDRYHRILASCSVDGTDVSRAIAENGWAVAEPEYLVPQLAARAAGRGIWVGRFEQPADWRRNHGESPPGVLEWLRSLL